MSLNVMSLMATIGLDSSEYEKGLNGATSSAQDFAGKFKKILGKLAIGVGIAKLSQGIVGITKNVVNAFKDYEQLVGGVETFFGTGGKSFEEYAAGASESLYKMGQRGEDILALQKELVAAGYDIGAAGADGIYGPKTQAAFDAYAKAGGQLVKDSYADLTAVQNKVIDNAWNAFETAGLSANDYMDTVTSFSASLIKSVGGDTEKAVELADMAITDMADNANKMGTDIGSIQNAYQGFAKQNYTMLDNLKLGYAGTKTGMEELIAEANRLRKEQGKTGDLTIEKFSDIVEAIHLVQESQGIAGTTAKEASDTIQGSLSATKAAWQNLLISFGTGNSSDMKKAMDGLIKSAKNLVKNITPVITNALKGIGSFVTEMAPVLAAELPTLISEVVPAFVEALGSLLSSLVQNLPAILSGLGGAIKKLITGNENASWPEVGQAILNGINDVLGNIGSKIKELITGDKDANWGEVGAEIWTKIKDGISDTGDWLKAKLGYSPDASWSDIGLDLWNKIKGGISATGDWLKEKLGYSPDASWSEVGLDLWNKVKAGIVETGDWLKAKLGYSPDASWSEIGAGIWETIKSGISATGDWLKAQLGYSPDASWGEIGANIWATIKGGISDAGDWLKTQLGYSPDASWSEIGASIWAIIKSGISDTGDWLKAKLGYAPDDSWTQVGADIQTKIITGLNNLGTTLANLFDNAKEGISSVDWTSVGSGIWEKIKSAFAGLFGLFSRLFQEGKNGAETGVDWTGLGKSIYDFVVSGLQGLQDFMGGLFSAIYKDITGMTWGDTVSGIKRAWDGIGEWFEQTIGAVKRVFNGIKETLSKPFDTASEAVSGILSAATTVSESIGGVFESIASAIQAPIQTIIEWVNSAIAKVKELLGLGSEENVQQVEVNAKKSLPGGNNQPGSGGGRGGRQVNYVDHATAMSHGEILRGLTPFGVGADGTMHFGGEAGAEAVVGVNSLDKMIQESVNNAIGAVLGKMDTLINGQNRGDTQIVLDTGELVGGMKREIDKQLGAYGRWRGGGRA